MDSWQGSRFEPASLHRYSYVGNDPATMSDPTGEYEGLSSAMTTIAAQMNLIGTRLAAGAISRLGAARALRALQWTASILSAAYARFGDILVSLEHGLESGSGRVDIVLKAGTTALRRAVIEAKNWNFDAIAYAPGRAASMLEQLRIQATTYGAEFGDDLIYAFAELPHTAGGQALMREAELVLQSAGVQRVTFGVQSLMIETARLLGP
jgi:hypothetical protein